MGGLRVGVGQVRRFSHFREGVDWLRDLIKGLIADVIVLPENWIGVKVLSKSEFDEYVDLLRELSSEVGSIIIGGSAYVDLGGRTISICPIVSSKGLINYSEKIRPSRATGERLSVSGGSRLGVIDLGDWRVGCVVCIDAMYPEITRALARHGVDIIVNPSSISVDRAQLWRSLGLIRAFENSAYFASAMGTGYKYPDGRDVLGGSFIASPNGEYVLTVELGAEGLYTVNLNHEEIEYARARRGYMEDLINDYLSKVQVSIVEV
nr:MAG: nitrilase [Vulcanisaeta sp. AZ3]